MAIVACSRFLDTQKELLRNLTGEVGPFELGSIGVLLLLGIVAIYNLKELRRRDREIAFRHWIFIAAIGALAILAALEESSWGQHFFSFESNQFFTTHNQQQETNLHNLLPPEVFGLAVNLLVYVIFVYTPLLLYMSNNTKLHGALNGDLSKFAPSLHTIIIFCFGFSLQAYFKIETLTDTLALVVALFLLGYFLFVKSEEARVSEKLHFCILLVATSLFAYCYEVFSFENVQYEIREFIFIYGFTFWFWNYTYVLRTDSCDEKQWFIK